MNAETDLRTAIAYLADLDAELDERSALADAGVHAAAAADMRYQLEHACALLARPGHRASNLSCISFHDSRGALMDVAKARAWCRAVEGRIAGLLRGISAAA